MAINERPSIRELTERTGSVSKLTGPELFKLESDLYGYTESASNDRAREAAGQLLARVCFELGGRIDEQDLATVTEFQTDIEASLQAVEAGTVNLR